MKVKNIWSTFWLKFEEIRRGINQMTKNAHWSIDLAKVNQVIALEWKFNVKFRVDYF